MRTKTPSRAPGTRLVTTSGLGLELLALTTLMLLAGCATGRPQERPTSGLDAYAQPFAVQGGCGGTSREAEALLASLLASTSPSDFVRLQRGVDMVRLVEGLDDWSAVRLGALGPVSAPVAALLNRKRASFLATCVREDGSVLAEVFALFVLHSSSDQDLKQVLHTLALDKRLGSTLGDMAVVREQLRRRGLPLSDFPDRPARPREDMTRGAREALTEAVSATPLLQWGASSGYDARKRQLPPPYQRALTQVENALVEQAFSPRHVAMGTLDELTFGVPLGFYYLAAGTGEGVSSLARGEYEQAARELTPAALMVALYAGGKGARALKPRLEELRQTARHLREQLGADGLEAVARYLQADPEAALLVAEGGEAGALALAESRGNVPGARAWLSQAQGAPPGSSPPKGGLAKGSAPGKAAALADEVVELPREVLDTKLLQGELESTGPRLSGDVAMLRRQLAALRDAPPAGAQSHPLWNEYVRYGQERLVELEQGTKAKRGRAVEPPLQWEGYQRMRGLVTRGLKFERAMAEVLRADAALPRAQRRFLGDFDKPRVEWYVGVWKPTSGLRFVDVLIIEEGPLSGRSPRVETISFKSRNLALLDEKALDAQMSTDARDALRYYGETLDIRRPSLRSLLHEGSEVPIQRVRLIYEGGDLKPRNVNALKRAIDDIELRIKGVEVLVQ
ncbi:hypothetical protein CYFUS_004349 [Cystobacter fuscus]|uniref:Uncharacterized protein n=1 Tax=Cystobacter fuscus TaxID=43 RepID=A0A250J621_9BACT|nr:hypothetical protein [Cystobacter fuscus]ATB38912.1 hypothetical protein CYFUS_004349 [Cystobacter fuscus]